MHTSTRGGSSETEANELAVIPWTLPGARSVVMIVTPLANWPRAWRNSTDVSGVVDMAEEIEDTMWSEALETVGS
jgi:hypothetical protein